MVDVGSEVKRRSYDAKRRRARSAETRQRIIDAARSLMLTDGYRATSVAAIAARAGVNVDTVYDLVGRKPFIVRELIEQSVSGRDHPVPAEERGYVLAIRAEPDPSRKLAIYAGAVRQTQQRLAPLFRVIREAMPSEPEITAVWNEIAARRAANMRTFITDVNTTGALREDLTVERAADIVWTLNSSDVYLLLTEERGWSPEEFEQWLADSWARLLLR
jgi:AcrR family transcriptional regulator